MSTIYLVLIVFIFQEIVMFEIYFSMPNICFIPFFKLFPYKSSWVFGTLFFGLFELKLLRNVLVDDCEFG
jgi:hypothetical protein